MLSLCQIILVILTKSTALDKVNAAGDGEGAYAWRCSRECYGPKVRSRFIGLLLRIIGYRFSGELQAAIEAWEKEIRLYEKQTTHNMRNNDNITNNHT